MTQARRNAGAARALMALTLGMATGAAFAQAYPSKPIRIIAPYAAGGAADLMGRYMCEKFPQSMGQPCVVENRPGAGGIIGMDLMLKSDPDGHTVAMMPNNLSIIPGVFAKVPYDTVRDVAPIALVSTTPVMIGVHPGVPARSLAELVAYAKANDGKVNFTTCGPASPQHLGGEMLASMAGFKWAHVPYKGCGDAIAGVLSGTVPVFISTYAHFAPQIKAGKLRGFVVTGARRTPLAPEFPTVAESGYPGYDVDVWFGMVGSAKLPPAIISRLNAEVNKALAAPDMREKMAAGQYEPVGGTPERFGEVIRADIAKYGKVSRDVGVKAE